MAIAAVSILMVTTGAVLIGCHPGVVLVPPLLPVGLEAQPVPGVAVGGVGHPARLDLLTQHCWLTGREL